MQIITSTENLKYQATRQPEADLIKQLHQLRGFKGSGINFNDVLYTAVIYFFDKIYTGSPSDSDWNIKTIKGYLDGCNHSPYTAVDRIVCDYKELSNAPLFNEVFLIINTAYFFSERYGKHQFLEYLEHYQKTKTSLPFEAYQYDIEYLKFQYTKIDANNLNIDIQKRYWYFATIEILLNELQITNPNYNQVEKEGQNRIFNNLALCSRTLRSEMPFLIGEFDISTAYPTIFDELCETNIAPQLYDNIATSHNITRSEAKRLFNRKLNSAKYRNTEAKRNEYLSFLIKCGYSEQHAKIIMAVTDDPNNKFYDFGTEVEKELIDLFKNNNYLLRGTRLHDALFFIMHNDINYNSLKTDFNRFRFVFKQHNNIKYNDTFYNGRKWLKSRSFQFAPKGVKCIHNIEIEAPADSIGRINKVFTIETKKGNKDIELDIEFFNTPSKYITANFETTTNKGDDVFLCIDDLLKQYHKSFGFIANNTALTPETIKTILQHHRKYSNLCFDITTMASYIELMEFDNLTYELKERNFKFYNDVSNLENDFILFSAIKKAEAIVKRNYKYKTLVDDFVSYMKNDNGSLFKTSFKSKDKDINSFVHFINQNLYGRVTEIKSKKVTNSDFIFHTYNSTIISSEYNLEICHKKIAKTRHKERKTKLLKHKKELQKIHAKNIEAHKTVNTIFYAFFKHNFNHEILLNFNQEFINNLIEAHRPKTNKNEQLPNIEKESLQWDKHNRTDSVLFNKPPTTTEIETNTPYFRSFKRYHAKDWRNVYDHISNNTYHLYKKQYKSQQEGNPIKFGSNNQQLIMI